MFSRCFLLILVVCVHCTEFTVSVFSYNVKGGKPGQPCCWTEPHGKKGPPRDWQYDKMKTLVAKESYDFLSLVETRDHQSSYEFPATKNGCTPTEEIIHGISSDYDAADQSPWGYGCNTILYRKDKWKAESQAQYWVCNDREKGHGTSPGDDRVMSAARFASTTNSNEKVVFVSIQYPHIDKPKPNEDYMAAIKHLAEDGKYPVIFAGDMNRNEQQTTHQMKKDSGDWSVSTSKDLGSHRKHSCCADNSWDNSYDHIAVMTKPNSEWTGKVDANFITGWEQDDSYSHLHNLGGSAEHLPIDGKVTFTANTMSSDSKFMMGSNSMRPESKQENDPVDTKSAFKVMSYNTQYTGYADGRVPSYGKQIQKVGAAVVGTQECQDMKGLERAASPYKLVPDTGFQNPIYYNPGLVSFEGKSGYEPIPRDNYAERTFTYAKFKWKATGQDFWFFDTHLPHNHGDATDPYTHSKIARQLLDKRKELGAGDKPTVVVCDCNSFASNGATKSFRSVLKEGGIPEVYVATGKDGGHPNLDRIFMSKDHFEQARGDDSGLGGSDHTSIAVEAKFKADEDARQEHAQEDHHVDHHDVHAALSNTAGSRCGYTVNGDPKRDPRRYKNKSCAETGQEVGKTMDCFGYGEPGDWCSFSFTNPTPSGTTPNLDKCKGSSIFLHDEPKTQADRGYGSGYKGAAKQWIDWSNKNSAALKKFRARGGSVVGPAVKNNHALENTKAFFDACGSPCNDKNSPSYIDVYAINLFMGSWNNGNLVGAISWSMDIVKKIRSQLGDRKVDFTNYSYLGRDATPQTHLNAMKAIEEYSSKPDWQHIRKVFFFFSKDDGGGTPDFNNRADQEVDGKTLGHWWKETCDKLDSSGKSNDATFVEVAASAMPVHAKILALGGLFTLVAFLFLRSRKHAQDKELYQVLTNAIEEEI